MKKDDITFGGCVQYIAFLLLAIVIWLLLVGFPDFMCNWSFINC